MATKELARSLVEISAGDTEQFVEKIISAVRHPDMNDKTVEKMLEMITKTFVPAIYSSMTDSFAKEFTEEQIKTILAFHKDNPWYVEKLAIIASTNTIAIHNETQLLAQLLDKRMDEIESDITDDLMNVAMQKACDDYQMEKLEFTKIFMGK